MAPSTTSAIAFWSATVSAQSAPSSGAPMTASTSPPVTALSVPMESSTKPQKMPECMSAARGSWYIRVWSTA
jgi:hypothetical protein